jgi:acetyl-CoA carboxylase biotin carboxylase subunit
VFDRVLVANRGEIAVRVIRALHELGIEAVAVYSTADRDALHVELADHAVCIGPPSAIESYLRISNVVAAAGTTGCEQSTPATGPGRERGVRARATTTTSFIGPTARSSSNGRQGAGGGDAAAGVPLVPGLTAPSAWISPAGGDAGSCAPKASAGGGGKACA